MPRFDFLPAQIATRAIALASALCMSGWTATAAAEDPIFRISTGVDYSTGDYGDVVDTDIVYVPVTGKLIWGDFTARVNGPLS